MGSCFSALRSAKPHLDPRTESPIHISPPIATPVPSETSPLVDLPHSRAPSTDVKRLTATNTRVPLTTSPSTKPMFDVFISHAGEDKATIAFPLRERLMKHGLTVFVDETDIEPGADAQKAMIDAMETAKVAVIVLSPEFVARKWPIKELLCFLRRVEEGASDDPQVPMIIPFFYRLAIDDLYHEPRLDRRDKDGDGLYEKSRFFERLKNDEPEANISTINSSLRKLHGFMGVRNDFDASNDSAHIAYRRRGVLLEELCDKIRQTIVVNTVTTTLNFSERTGADNPFHPYFDSAQDASDLVFDFDYENEEISKCSQEARLLKLVLDESQTENTSIAVRGIGGVGKTSLMRGISYLNVVRQHFKDGVFRLSVGVDVTTRDLIDELSKAVELSGGRENADLMRKENKIENVLQGFRTWFEKRKCLFIIDDVWQTSEMPTSVICELLRLHASGQDSKVLLTTRSTDIASLARCIVCLEPRGTIATESRRILLRYAGIKPDNDNDDRAVTEILERCGGLPLFLAVSGKAIKALSSRTGHKGCVAYHAYARKLNESLQNLLTSDSASHARLDSSLIIALDLLEERKRDFGFQIPLSIRKMYRRLSVLRKQSKVPMRMLRFLWKLENDDHAACISGELEKVGLADLEFEERDGGYVELLRIHDSHHEFAAIETRKHYEEKEGHQALLEGYGRGLAMREQCHEWWHTSIDADGYIHANLCRHLLAAGESAELIALLLSPQWAERQVKLNDILLFEADLLLGVKALQDSTREGSDHEGAEARTAIQLISGAVALSSGFVRKNVAELCFQLHGRLKGFREGCTAINKYVSWIETDTEGPLVLCSSSFLGEPGGRNTRITPIGVPVECMTVMKGGDSVACGCEDGRIYVVDATRGVVGKHWAAHDAELNAITVCKDDTRIISGSDDKTAKVWHVNTGRCATMFTGHTNGVDCVAVMGDGRRVLSVSAESCAIMWDMETGQSLSMLTTVHSVIACVATVGNGEVAVTGGTDGKLRMWNLASNEQVGDAFDGHEDGITCVAVTPDGKRIVSGSYDRTMRVWDVGSRQQIVTVVMGQFCYVKCVAVSEDGRRIVSGSSDKKIQAWNLVSGTQICDPLEGHTDGVTGVSFQGGADRILSCSWDGTFRVWDVTREKKRPSAHQHHDRVSGVSFTPDGDFVVTASYDRTIRIWNSASGKQVGDPLQAHSDDVNDVAVTPNGSLFLSVSDDNTLRVWDFETRQLLHTFPGHTDPVRSVAVTPQGDRAVTGSEDKTIRVWDLAAMDGSHFVLEGHSTFVLRVFVSDDGLRIISVDLNGNMFVWELETRKLDKRFRQEDAWKLSRREILMLVDEVTVHDDTTLSIPRYGRHIVHGERPHTTVLATMEALVESWALSPSKRTMCLGLQSGHVMFLKLLL